MSRGDITNNWTMTKIPKPTNGRKLHKRLKALPCVARCHGCPFFAQNCTKGYLNTVKCEYTDMFGYFDQNVMNDKSGV